MPAVPRGADGVAVAPDAAQAALGDEPWADEVFGLATDDVLHFTRAGRAKAKRSMRRLEDGFRCEGVLRNERKDVTGELVPSPRVSST